MVAAKKNAQTKSYPNNSFDDFLELLKKLKEGIVEPFYVLYGDEPYFIEQIIKEVTTRTIAPENKEFNYAEFNVAISNISDIQETNYQKSTRAVFQVGFIYRAARGTNIRICPDVRRTN